ncbi:MAG: hypothetical protein U0105_13370 [Candidatus Obscuribacterales bacterium]
MSERHRYGLGGLHELLRPHRNSPDDRNLPFDKVSEAYELMMSGKARFRVVIEQDS